MLNLHFDDVTMCMVWRNRYKTFQRNGQEACTFARKIKMTSKQREDFPMRFAQLACSLNILIASEALSLNDVMKVKVSLLVI